MRILGTSSVEEGYDGGECERGGYVCVMYEESRPYDNRYTRWCERSSMLSNKIYRAENVGFDSGNHREPLIKTPNENIYCVKGGDGGKTTEEFFKPTPFGVS